MCCSDCWLQELNDETMVVQSQDLTNNPEFLRLLQAIATVSESNSDIINAYIESMAVWREAQLAAADNLEIGSRALSHVVEVLFGVTVLRTLLVPGCSDALQDRMSDQLEEIASSHLLQAVTRAAVRSSGGQGAGAAPTVQMRFAQRDICDPTPATETGGHQFSVHELYFPKTTIWFDSMVVAEVSARIIGVLSHSKLASVTARFLSRLETAVRMTATKDKALRLTHESVEIVRALRYVRLGIQQLDYSVDFMTKIVTLMEQQRLSTELKHELCALLVACLERIPTDESMRQTVRRDGEGTGSDHSSAVVGLRAWDRVVARTYQKVSEWAAKPRHLAASCRALAALVVSFSTEADGVQEHKHKLAQALVQLLVKNCSDRSLRGVLLASIRTVIKLRLSSHVRGFVDLGLVKAVEFGLVHLVAEIFRRPDSKSKAKDREEGPVLTVAQLDLLVEAAVLFGARDRGRATHAESSGLNFVIEQLVLPSLDRTQNSGQRTDEMQLQFGMRTFIGICREYEVLFFSPGSPEVAAFNPKVLMEPSLQRHARKVGPYLSMLLTHYSGELARQGSIQPESSLAQMVTTLVGCIPRAIPLMPYEKLQKCLIMLALGNVKEIRDAVLACFVRFVHVWPPLRSTIVRAFCDEIIRQQNSGATRDNDRILRAVRNLKVIVDEWAMLGDFTRRPQYEDGSEGTFHGIRQDWAASAEGETSFLTDPTKGTVVIESTALCLLCSTHPEVRWYGFELLQSSHDLEERLLDDGKAADACHLSLVQLLEHAAPAIIERALVGAASQRGSESLGGTFAQLVAFASGHQGSNDHDQVRWCRCLAEVCTFVGALRCDVASCFCQLAAQAAKSTAPSEEAGDIQVHKWRNYTVAALSSVSAGAQSQSQQGLIVDLVELVKTVLCSSNATQRSASVLVLGLASHPAVYTVYHQDLLLLNAVSMLQGSNRLDLLQEQLRADLMKVHRIIAERMQLSALDEKKIDHLLSFVESSVAYSNSILDMKDRSALLEMDTLRVDFCLVVRYVAEAAYDEGVTRFTSDLRRQTFKLLSEWCAYGMTRGVGLKRRQDVDMDHEKHVKQIDDVQKRRELIKRYSQQWSRLEEASNHTICYLFWGSVMEEADPDLIFRWGKHVCQKVQDPTLWHPMMGALEKHLISTPTLLPKYIDHCYDTGELLGKESTQLLYFNAITAAGSRRAYSEESDLAALWTVALYHSASTSEVLRNAAALLLRVLIRQIKSESTMASRLSSATIFAALITSNVSDVYEAQSNLLSSQLSAAFPELSGRILLEVFRRLAIRLTAETSAERLARCNKMLAILEPWMQNFVLGNYRKVASPSFSTESLSPVGATGSPGSEASILLSTDSKDLETSQILGCMFSLTQSLGVEHSQGIQIMWRSVVTNRAHNTVPVLAFCIDKVVDTYENDPEALFVLVAQQITLYMARCHTDLTVRTLMDQVSMLPETPSSRVSRSNVATILLIEIIHESSAEYLSDHTPLLLHIAIVGMDHDDAHYAKYCSRLLVNLLQTLVLKAPAHAQLGKHASACDKATRMVQFLDSRDAQDTWHDGDAVAAPGTGQSPPEELQWAIDCIIDSMAHSVPDLRLRWSNLALQYPLMDSREDIVIRSHQIFRFLRHEIQLQHAKQLLFASHAYCHVGRNGTSFLAETAATIGFVMQRPDQLERLCMMFPQFFWFAAALCQSDTPVLYITGLRLLRAVLPTYAAHDGARRSLQAGFAAAKSWSRPFRGVQELVMRGLSTAQTEEYSISTLRLLLTVSLKNADDAVITGVCGDDGARTTSLAVQLVGGLLPWLCYHLEQANMSARPLHPDASSTAREMATFCGQRGLQMLVPSFMAFAESAYSVVTSGFDTSAFLASLSEPLRAAMGGVGIAGRMYGPWLAHLGQAPAGLHARRYARQVLEVLLTVLRDAKHLVASQMTSAEEEAATQSGHSREVLPEHAILPLLTKRVSEFAALRDLSDIAVQVLSAAAIAEQQLSVDTTGRRSEPKSRGAITMHELNSIYIIVGKADQVEDERVGLKGTVIQAWSAEQQQRSSYLSLQLGDEVVLTQAQHISFTEDSSRSWSSGYIARRRTASGLFVPLANTGEGLFPTECVKIEEAGESTDSHSSIQQEAQDANENVDTAQALFAICRTLPGSTDPQVTAGVVSEDATATCDDHALWLAPPVVIPSERAQRVGAKSGLLLKPRFVSVSVPAGSVEHADQTRAGRGATSEVRYQSSNRPVLISPEQGYYDGRSGTILHGDAAGWSPVPSTLGRTTQLKDLQNLMRTQMVTRSASDEQLWLSAGIRGSESDRQSERERGRGHARSPSAASVSNSTAEFEPRRA